MLTGSIRHEKTKILVAVGNEYLLPGLSIYGDADGERPTTTRLSARMSSRGTPKETGIVCWSYTSDGKSSGDIPP